MTLLKHKPPNTIWMIISSFHPLTGGAQRQAQRLSEQLLKLGWSVHVVTRRHIKSYGYSGVAEEVINDIPVHRVFSKGSGALGAMFYILSGLWLMLRYGRNCVYYAHDLGSPAWLAVIACHLMGGNCIVKIRSGANAYTVVFRSLWQRMQVYWLLKFVNGFIVVSQETLQMLKQWGIAADRILLLHNGIDSDRFCPIYKSEKLAVRQRLEFPPDKAVALCVGRLAPVKGLDVLIEAWAGLPLEIRHHLSLVIVGDGPERYRLEELAQAKNIFGDIRFEGHQEEVIDYFNAADIYILPSRSEGLSNALVEAMACGLPVICSAVGGALDWIQPSLNGFLFPSENCEQLRDALIKMLSHRDKWQEMGNYSRQLVKRKLALSIIGQQFSEWLFQLSNRDSTSG